MRCRPSRRAARRLRRPARPHTPPNPTSPTRSTSPPPGPTALASPRRPRRVSHRSARTTPRDRAGGDVRGVRRGRCRVLRRPARRQQQGLLDRPPRHLRERRPGAHAGAARGPGARVRSGQGLPAVPRRPVLARQDSVQDGLRGHRRSVLRPGLGGRTAGRRRAVPVGRRTSSPASAPPSTTTAAAATSRPASRPSRPRTWTGRRPAWPAIASPPGPAASPPITRGWSCCATAASTPTAGGSPTTSLHEAATAERVAAVWRATRPLTDWLDDHVGPPEHSR